MDKKQENILGWVVIIGFSSHLYSYFFWEEIIGVNIFYITIYFNADILGFALFVLTRESKILKGAGVIGMGAGSYLFFCEFNNPVYWEQRDFLTLGMIFINVFFLIIFTERLKHKK